MARLKSKPQEKSTKNLPAGRQAKGKGTKSEELIAVARKRGYISQDEILNAFPKPEDHIEELDLLYDQLLKKGVDIFETVEEEKESQKSIEDLERELEALNIIQGGAVTDPVRMYLKEIGRIPLLVLPAARPKSLLIRPLLQYRRFLRRKGRQPGEAINSRPNNGF